MDNFFLDEKYKKVVLELNGKLSYFTLIFSISEISHPTVSTLFDSIKKNIFGFPRPVFYIIFSE